MIRLYSRALAPSARCSTRLLAALGLLGLLLTAGPSEAQAPGLEGAWRIESFTGGGSTGPTTGQMLFQSGRWTLIYTMDEQGQPKAGRAHGGGYTVGGETLTLHVEWSMQRVGGSATVSERTSDNVTKHKLEGNRLTINFNSGGTMQFQRVSAR